ncbi:MAG: phage tail tape measure protein [Candidatus Accumulibacter sp.]|jgi:TP901 family phage tail tape measure protein|nr:phage tail tape measure protein [Accumulibacter sp.]
MANELFVGLTIGASLSGTFGAVFGNSRRALAQLGDAAKSLGSRHQRLGEIMARALQHPMRNLGALRGQYERLGQTLDTLRRQHERLSANLARGENLRANRLSFYGKAMETYMQAMAIGRPVTAALGSSMQFQDQIKDISITGEFSGAEEARLGATVRETAVRFNQTTEEVARGLNVLVAGGIQSAAELERYAAPMSKAATGSRASMDDLGSVALALNDSLKIGAEGFEGALNMLSYAGKRGQFEIKDMARHLPTIAPAFAALGVTGKEAVAEIGAAFQIARKGAGTNDEAANNFRNFIQKLTSPDTIKSFADAGIDLQASMTNLRAQGLTPVQAMLEMVSDYMGKKSPQAAGEFKKAMALKDEAERQAALDRLSEAYKLGELFRDMQAMSFIRPAVQNMNEMQDIKQGSLAAADKGLLDADYKKRMEGFSEQFKSFKLTLSELGLTIGETLLPPLMGLVNAVRPAVSWFGEWAKQHPGLLRGVAGLVGGLLAGKIAFLALGYGLNLFLTPFNAFARFGLTLAARFTLLRSLSLSGVSGFRLIAQVMGVSAGRAAQLAGIFPRLGSAASVGLGMAVKAFNILKLVVVGHPIGAVVTLLAMGAFAIWRNWSTIWPKVKSMIAGIAPHFAGVVSSIGATIVNFSPLGLVYRAFAPVLRWFGLDLPDTLSGLGSNAIGALADGFKSMFPNAYQKIVELGSGLIKWFKETLGIASPSKVFMDFGAHMIGGLIAGITGSLSAARDSIVSFGKNVAGWFKKTLDISSPSKVFMGFGGHIGQGLGIGITNTVPIARRAAGQLAGAALAGAVAAGNALAYMEPPHWEAPFRGQETEEKRQSLPAAQSAALWSEDSRGGQKQRGDGLSEPLKSLKLTLSEIAQMKPGADRRGAQTGDGAGGLTVNFSPSITVQAEGGGRRDVKEQVSDALKLSLHDLERMMERVMANKARRSYAN